MNRKERRIAQTQQKPAKAAPVDPFSKAIALHQAGNLAEAEAIYKALLATNPANADALSLLGTIRAQQGNFAESLQLLEQAIAINPSHLEAHNNRGTFLRHLGRYEEALASFDRALAINPQYIAAHKNRGNALLALHRPEEAQTSFNIALSLQPKRPQAELLADANTFLQAGKLNEAQNLYKTLLADDPTHAEALNLLGTIYAQQGDLPTGLRLIEQAIAQQPGYAQAHVNRGVALHQMKRYEESVASYDKALAINPRFAEAHNHRAPALCEMKRYDEAIKSFEKAIALNAHYAEAYYGKAMIQLNLGEYEEGWRLHEWRWKTQFRAKEVRGFKQPLWLGEKVLAGKTILLHAEQGLGDTIQFCRYAPMVVALGAKVILEVQSALTGLIATLNMPCEIIAAGAPLPEFDFHCPLMSLPLAFRTNVNTVPANAAYLQADPVKCKAWQERLGVRTKPRIGLVWSGRPQHKNDHNRSIPLNQLAPLLACDVEFHSLQKEIKPADEAALASSKIISHAEALKDFADTAALVSQMDVVISVDTSVAHLAGALGKPVWVLISYMPDFRWMEAREDSPWYKTARLFRQQKYGDWDSVFARLADELKSSNFTG